MNPMTLFTAMHVLARAHTEDNRQTGFTVRPLGFGSVSTQDYIEAWKVVRRELGLQVDPDIAAERARHLFQATLNPPTGAAPVVTV